MIIVTGAATVLLDRDMGPKSKKRQGLAPPRLFQQLDPYQPGRLKEVLKGRRQEGITTLLFSTEGFQDAA